MQLRQLQKPVSQNAVRNYLVHPSIPGIASEEHASWVSKEAIHLDNGFRFKYIPGKHFSNKYKKSVAFDAIVS